MHFKWEDKQLIYMQLRTVLLFLLYLIILIITLNILIITLKIYTILPIFAVLFWRIEDPWSSQEQPSSKQKACGRSSQLHVKNEQLSSMNKWVFSVVSVHQFLFFFQYANLVFMLLVMKTIVISLWLTMKSEVGSSNC